MPSGPSGYSASEVARLVGLSVDQVRSYVRNGLIDAERGARGAYLFSFQDVVLIRAARDLVKARVPRRRIRNALQQLKDSLPRGRSLSGLRISAESDHVVVQDGDRRWSPDSGQLHFDFEVKDLAKAAAPLARRRVREACAAGDDMDADDWYDLAFEMEAPAPTDAASAYRRALELDPEHVDARVNLGRLLHEAGEVAEAETHYRAALERDPETEIAAFNLGVVLEDQGRLSDAADAYESVLRRNGDHADAHYNAAGLYERLGDARRALRHLKAYRELTRRDR